jgi:ABC-type uncharacterized transport system ATPase subunit
LKRASVRRHVRIGFDRAAGPGWLDGLHGVLVTRPGLDQTELELTNGVEPDAVLAAALASGAGVTRFEVAEPTLEAIFIERVGRAPDDDERTLAAP